MDLVDKNDETMRQTPAAPALARKPANQPVAVVVKTYTFTRPDGSTVPLPEAEYQAERAKAAAKLRTASVMSA